MNINQSVNLSVYIDGIRLTVYADRITDKIYRIVFFFKKKQVVDMKDFASDFC